jgi:signal transduction histidine kinase
MVDIDSFFARNDQTIVYRIFQEVLNNIGKHAQAARISVVIARENGTISFTLEDDGKGFDIHSVSQRDLDQKGWGLDILDERVRMLGGVFEVSSREGEGTRITFRVPVAQGGGT